MCSQNLFKPILIVLLSLVSLAFTQNTKIVIKGNVSDSNGKPLSYANVYIDKSIIGAMTDEQGNFEFSITAPGTYTLICSYVGYINFNKEYNFKENQVYELTIIMSEEIMEADEIKVTASAFTSGDKKGVTLSSLEVVTTPGAAADVMLAMRTFPGVQQVEEGAGLFVRGGDVSETVIVLDGAYFSHPYRYESPSGGYRGTISPFLLKGTYFSSGGFDAEYGNALSGALVMESLDLPTKRSISMGVGLAAYSGSVRLPLIENKLGMSLSGNYSNTRNMFKLNKSTAEFFNYPESYDINMNLFYRYSDRGFIKLFLFSEKDKVGLEIEKPEKIESYEGSGRNSFVNLYWNHLYGTNFLLKGNFAVSNYTSERKIDSFNLDTDDQLYQFRIGGEYNLSNYFKWKFGAEYFLNKEQIAGQSYLNDQNQIYSFNVDYLSHKATLYSSWQMNLSDSYNYSFGLRYEKESESGQQFLDTRGTFNWNIYKDWNFVASIGRYHQFPQTFYYDPSVGNPGLKSMSSTHYIAGFARQTENEIYRLEFYYKNYKNLLLNDPVINYSNEGYGYAKGIDLFLKKDWGVVDGWISASYLNSKRKWKDAPGLKPTNFDITYNLTAVLKVDLFTSHWFLGSTYRFASGKPYTSSLNSYHDNRVPDYHRLDLSISYFYRFFEGNLSIFYLAVSNALNKENIMNYYYSDDYSKRIPVSSSMQRNFYFGIQTNF